MDNHKDSKSAYKKYVMCLLEMTYDDRDWEGPGVVSFLAFPRRCPHCCHRRGPYEGLWPWYHSLLLQPGLSVLVPTHYQAAGEGLKTQNCSVRRVVSIIMH